MALFNRLRWAISVLMISSVVMPDPLNDITGQKVQAGWLRQDSGVKDL